MAFPVSIDFALILVVGGGRPFAVRAASAETVRENSGDGSGATEPCDVCGRPVARIASPQEPSDPTLPGRPLSGRRDAVHSPTPCPVVPIVFECKLMFFFFLFYYSMLK